MALTNEVKILREELAKKGKRTGKDKLEHTKLQSEAKLLGKAVKRYEDNIAELKATIAKQENKLNQKDVSTSNGNLLDNRNGKGKEGLSEVVVTKDLLKSIDEILQSKLVAVEERLKETMTNEIGKNKQNIEAVIKENTTYAEGTSGNLHIGRAEKINATEFKSILHEARNDQLIERKAMQVFYYSWSSRERH